MRGRGVDWFEIKINSFDLWMKFAHTCVCVCADICMVRYVWCDVDCVLHVVCVLSVVSEYIRVHTGNGSLDSIDARTLTGTAVVDELIL